MGICLSKSRRQINERSSHEPNAPLPITLPDELITEVLSFLDVKSLMRFKCLSKSWNSLISDPFFVELHLSKSSRNSHIALLRPHSEDGYTPLKIFPMHSLFNTQFAAAPNYRLMDRGLYYQLIGSCNGLICLRGYSYIPKYPKFSLFFWNPAKRSFSEKLASFSDEAPHPDFKFSFGYDNLSGKYKVVAFRPNDVRVFTLGDNVWRKIQCFPTHPHIYSYYHMTTHGAYLNNSFNWFAIRNNVIPDHPYDWKNISVDQFVIISLDLGMETYTQMLPPQDFDQVPYFAPIVCVLMECLCFTYCSKEYNFTIWQMREFRVEKSWTKLLKFSYQINYVYYGYYGYYCYLLPLHVFENGDILILASDDQRRVILYNRRDNRVDKIVGYGIYWFFIEHYVESLVSTNC